MGNGKEVVAVKTAQTGERKRLVVAHIQNGDLQDNVIYFVEIENTNTFDKFKSLGFGADKVRKINKIEILLKRESLELEEATKLFNGIAEDLRGYKDSLDKRFIRIIEQEREEYTKPVVLSAREQERFNRLKGEGLSIKEIAKLIKVDAKALKEYYHTNYKRHNKVNIKLGVTGSKIKLNKEKYPDMQISLKK